MRAGIASYSNSRQSHSLLRRAPWKGEMCKTLDFSTWEKTLLLSGTTSESTQHMAGFSMYELVRTNLFWFGVFLFACLSVCFNFLFFFILIF